MFSRSNLTNLKTTILGLMVLGASLAYPFIAANTNPWVFGIMITVGIALLFLPDTLFKSLTNLLTKNSGKQF